MIYKSPAVLLISFRRADLTKKMLENIEMSNPSKVYVSCDGPRLNKDGEVERVNEVRAVIDSFEKRLQLVKRYSSENLGCARNMSESITWFFEHEEEGIILEDDCYPDQSFYRYCSELLDFYRDDKRVMQISGYNYYEKAPMPHDDSYFFSYIGWQWGWATWRRAWRMFDVKIKDWHEFKARGLADAPPFFPLRTNRLDELSSKGNKIDSWAYPWQGCMAMNNGLSVVPVKSLVVNIGNNYGCTHGIELGKATKIGPDATEMKFPLRHPKFVVAEVEYDNYIKQMRKDTIYKKIRRLGGCILRKAGLR